MGAHSIAKADRPRPAAGRLAAAWRRREPAFWVGLGCAALLHAAVLLEVSRSSSPLLIRQMGERDGSKDTLNVDIVDAADLPGLITPPRSESPPVKPAEPAQSAPPHREAAREPTKSDPGQGPKVPTWSFETQALSPQPQTQPHPQPEPQSEPQPSHAAPSPPAKPKPKVSAQPTQPTPPLDLSLPDAALASIGRGAAVARPAGITRSGENDDFGRGVIRALRQTMPRPRDTLGRVTVRLLLTDTGNLAEVRLIRGSGDPILDQNVMFAVKQSSFPLPPLGSTLVDRTFLVTYVYH
jgi:TonB family protein